MQCYITYPVKCFILLLSCKVWVAKFGNFITFCGEVPFLYKDTILVPGRAIAPSLPNEHIPILVRVVLVLKIKQCLMLCDVPSAYDGSVDEAAEGRFTNDNYVSCYAAHRMYLQKITFSIQLRE